MRTREFRLILLLLLGAAAPLQAMDLQRLAPTVGRSGSEIHLLGSGFGTVVGGRSVVIQPRGESTRVRMAVVRWSERDILVRVPNGVTPGIYEISILSPDSQSRSQPLSVLPTLNRDYDAESRGDEGWQHPPLELKSDRLPGREPADRFTASPSLKLKPGLSPQDNAGSLKRDPGFSLKPAVTGTPGSGSGVAGAGCADPALVGMQVLHPQRNLDGSYRFRLRLQLRNLGRLPFEAEAVQTRLRLRQGAGILHSGYWPGPLSRRILLKPGHALSAEIPIAAMSVKQAARGLLADFAVVDKGAGESGPKECNTGNNQLGLDGARLQHALGIR